MPCRAEYRVGDDAGELNASRPVGPSTEQGSHICSHWLQMGIWGVKGHIRGPTLQRKHLQSSQRRTPVGRVKAHRQVVLTSSSVMYAKFPAFGETPAPRGPAATDGGNFRPHP